MCLCKYLAYVMCHSEFKIKHGSWKNDIVRKEIMFGPAYDAGQK